jgi:hypothetical protein
MTRDLGCQIEGITQPKPVSCVHQGLQVRLGDVEATLPPVNLIVS